MIQLDADLDAGADSWTENGMVSVVRHLRPSHHHRSGLGVEAFLVMNIPGASLMVVHRREESEPKAACSVATTQRTLAA